MDIQKDKKMVHEGNLVITTNGPIVSCDSSPYNEYPYNSYPYDSFKTLNRNLRMEVIKKGNIYFELSTGEEKKSGDQTNHNDYIYAYNIFNGTLKLVNDNMKIINIDGDYVITARPHGHDINNDDDLSNDSYNLFESFVYRFTDEGLEEIVSMGEYSNQADGTKLPKDNKLYFEVYKHHNMNIGGYEKEFTIATFDKKTEKVEEIATINIEGLVNGFSWYWLKKVEKDYCIISIRKEDEHSFTDYKFKYTFATKKAEEITKRK